MLVCLGAVWPGGELGALADAGLFQEHELWKGRQFWVFILSLSPCDIRQVISCFRRLICSTAVGALMSEYM